MVEKVRGKLGSRPFKKEDLEDYVNREQQPVVNEIRTKLNALLSRITEGEGSPEGVVTADTAAIYLRQDGGPGTLLYLKTTNNSATGWVAML